MLETGVVEAGPCSRLIPYNLPVLLQQPGFVIVIILLESEYISAGLGVLYWVSI